MTVDKNNRNHGEKGTRDAGRYQVERTNEPEGALEKPKTALDNPGLKKLVSAAFDAVRDADKATADAVKEYARETWVGAATIHLFKEDASDSDRFLVNRITDADGNEIDLGNTRDLEYHLNGVTEDNRYLLGETEWVGDDEDDNDDGYGYRMTIDLADEKLSSRVSLHLKDIADGYGPLYDVLLAVKDREEVSEDTLLSLDHADVEDMYDRHVAKAVDGIESDLLRPEYLVGDSPDVGAQVNARLDAMANHVTKR